MDTTQRSIVALSAALHAALVDGRAEQARQLGLDLLAAQSQLPGLDPRALAGLREELRNSEALAVALSDLADRRARAFLAVHLHEEA